MNNYIKAFLGGALVGAGIASLAFKVVEIIQLRKQGEIVAEPVTAEEKANDEASEASFEEEKPPIMSVMPSYMQEEDYMTNQTKKQKALRSYNKIRKDSKYGDVKEAEKELYYEDPEDDELLPGNEDEFEGDEPEEREHHVRELPVEIDNADYYDNPDFEKNSLMYFAKDDVMIFEGTDEIIEYPEDILGNRWREAVGKYDKDVAYIRDEFNCQDYAINFVDDYYDDENRQ